VGGKKVRGRQYPWGIIEVENEAHCDFVKLRHMLIRSHMEELKDHTNHVLYENYRIAKLAELGPLDSVVSST
jgi:septin 7